MSMPEIAEVAEPYAPHRGASSTMPQKANPVLCEAILTSNSFARQQLGVAYEALVADFERAGNSAWHVEWAFLPQSFTHCSVALEHAMELVGGLRVFPDNMKRNLGLSQGAVVAEHLVVAISETVGRARAHDVVYECCREALEKQIPLASAAADNDVITSVIAPDRVAWYTAPENYLGATLQFIDRVLTSRTRV
jgi:3-carboxy-cis,cis-muconate cycloisomerase